MGVEGLSDRILTIELFAPLQDDLAEVEARLRETTLDHQPALGEAVQHLVASGGKRVRPAVTLFTTRMLGGDPQPAIALAAAVEMLHTATLVHDDLIDGSLLRRGMPTLNARWTPAATVLTGDYLFARAAELAAGANSVPLMSVFARALMTIVNGEIGQLFDGRGQLSRAGYFQRIYAKTASLFEVSAEAAAIVADGRAPIVEAARTYGREVGMAFQIVDDILDFTSDAQHLGKPVGSDLRQGLFTLPALNYYAARPDDHDFNSLLNGRAGDPATVDRVVEAVRRSDAIPAALAEGRAYCDRAVAALSSLPGGPDRRALADLAEYFVSRRI